MRIRPRRSRSHPAAAAATALLLGAGPGAAWAQLADPLQSAGAAQPEPPPAAAPPPQDLRAIQLELQALKAQQAATEARIEALSRQVAIASGQPARPPDVIHLPITNPPRSGVVGKSTPGPGYWGAHDGGKGFTVARTDVGELNISGYLLGRYINQLPAHQTFTDHLGRVHTIDPRNDIQMQRLMLWVRGWIFTPKLRFDTTSWAVNSTEQATLVGSITYEFNKAVTLGVGIQRNQGSQTMHFNHPYWFAPDRVMADEYFRPGFASGVFVTGEPAPGLRYYAAIAPSLSQLGVNASQFTRDKAYSASIWWMPTTHEFGPKEGFGDFEHHEKLATLFSAAYVQHRADRFSQPSLDAPDNTQIRISDSLLLFEPDALAPGVTVQKADYRLASLAANFKYKGFAFHSEGYWRKLSDFDADGPLPLDTIVDTGFYIQMGYMVVPKTLEMYLSTSQIFGEFNNASEYIVGFNWFPFNTRNARMNFQFIDVNRSPASSLFGYYVGGQRGQTLSVAMDLIY